MSPNLDSPVHTQMSVSVLNCGLRAAYQKSQKMEGKPVGRRHVFVQTENGCVVGLELDRSDNAHMVKRKLHLALHVPTDEISLTFGDTILKNDLSGIRNASPLLLTRNLMHRSSSTPCLSPMCKDLQHRDRHVPIEVVGCSSCSSSINYLIKDVSTAIKNGVEPIRVYGGLGGAYYFRNIRGENIAIVKPTDEEPFAPNNPKGFIGKALGQPGLKPSVRVGETGFREVAAYLLDHEHFANVPPTVLVKVTHSIFNVNEEVDCKTNHQKKQVSKIASFQQFVHHDFDAGDHGTSSFPVSMVHRIGILDIRIFNTDRHSGNLLVRKLDKVGRFGEVELIPIDHGLCLPENLEDPYFEWIHWPQASIPFSDDELEYIEKLDPVKDSGMLRKELPMIREACIRVLALSTVFLKEAAAFGLCLSEIGEMMSREFSGFEEEPSELEVLCIEAKRLLVKREVFLPESKAGKEEQQFQLDIDSDDSNDFLTNPPYHFNVNANRRRSSLSRLEERLDEEDDDCNDEVEDFEGIPVAQAMNIPKLSLSLKHGVGIRENPLRQPVSGTPTSRRSANKQSPRSLNFVVLSDVSEEEWSTFLEKFHGLLRGSFATRKSSIVGSRQRQRLGTSCQF